MGFGQHEPLTKFKLDLMPQMCEDGEVFEFLKGNLIIMF